MGAGSTRNKKVKFIKLAEAKWKIKRQKFHGCLFKVNKAYLYQKVTYLIAT